MLRMLIGAFRGCQSTAFMPNAATPGYSLPPKSRPPRLLLGLRIQGPGSAQTTVSSSHFRPFLAKTDLRVTYQPKGFRSPAHGITMNPMLRALCKNPPTRSANARQVGWMHTLSSQRNRELGLAKPRRGILDSRTMPETCNHPIIHHCGKPTLQTAMRHLGI